MTVGCRLNQAESDALRQALALQGVAVVDDPAAADTCYVNTCTVTAAADRSSVQLVRRAARLAPRPRVVVLGCLAERAPGRLRAIPGVDEVWSNERKQAAIAGTGPAPRRSRALLKVQDGCERRCSYCVVSGLRGSPRSVAAELVLARFDALVAAGFREVVLTGLNLGCYRDGATDLARLVARLLERGETARVRLGSVEPDTVTAGVVAQFGHPRLCPHLHMPLQSGDDRLLAAMRRRYSAAAFAATLDAVRRVRPDLAAGADVICGFPGEDGASFARTRSFVESAGIDYLHVFAFSPRPGVAAAGMSGAAARAAVRARVAELRALSARRHREYAARYVGTVRPAVVETSRTALTDNYLRLAIRGPAPAPAALGWFEVEGSGDRLFGRAVDNPDRGPKLNASRVAHTTAPGYEQCPMMRARKEVL